MQWLRTTALFVVAQFAGVVPSPLATAASSSVGDAHKHHLNADGAGAISHSHDNEHEKHRADPCCGLHAFFTGVLPALIVVDPVDPPHQRLSAGLDDVVVGVDPGRLDRPPRPSAVI
jgi:hypothetical protein